MMKGEVHTINHMALQPSLHSLCYSYTGLLPSAWETLLLAICVGLPHLLQVSAQRFPFQ